MKKVELVNAFEFQREECGRRNFVPSVSYFPKPEDQVEHPELGEGFWCTRPNKVVCEFCKAIFEAWQPGPGKEGEFPPDGEAGND